MFNATCNQKTIKYSIFAILAISLTACNSSGSSAAGVGYQTMNSSTTTASSSTLITGIRQVSGSSNVYITGLFESTSTAQPQGLIYTGAITGSGTWQTLQYPGESVTSTSLYGPDSNGSSSVIIAGSYTTTTSGNQQLGLLYQGATNGSGTWSTLNPSSLVSGSESIINTIAHSTMGGLVVGNYDTNLSTGHAFIYNITNNSYIELKKPGALSTTAYGIWYNGGSSYTIAGGYSTTDESGLSTAYLVDWDSVTNTSSNWSSYIYNNGQSSSGFITHFEGITSNGSGYNLAADYAASDNINHAAFANITRTIGGNFSTNATWINIAYPQATITSANTVYQSYILGVYTLAATPGIVNSYVATVPF